MGKKLKRNKLFHSSSVQQPIAHGQQIMSVREEFSGPIPPPAVLERYNQIIPGAAERIFSMAEKQAEHRMGLEKTVIASDVKKSERGQIFGLLVAVVGLIVAYKLGMSGHEVLGGIIGGVDLLGLVGVFVLGRYEKTRERERSRQQLSSK